MLTPSLDTIRIFVHVLAAAVWVGGQIVLAGVVPRLREVGSDATKAAANGFATVAWPAFVIAVFTGMWNIFDVDMANAATEYHMTLGVKFLLVIAAGGSAFAHSRAQTAKVRGITGGVGAVASLVVLFLGVLMSHPS